MAGVFLVSGRQVDSRVELLDGWDACLVQRCTWIWNRLLLKKMFSNSSQGALIELLDFNF
jgi:hypothetical protein